MVYVQWLRVRNALKVTAIVFGALFLLAVIVHLSLDRLGTYNQMIDQISMQPGTSIQHTILPDGTPRSIIYNAKDRTRIVIDDHGYQGKQIIITEPASRQRTTHGHTIIGSINIVSSSNGRITTTVIDTDAPIESAYFIAAAMFVALMLATILGAPFARENDGHLEIALTKPIDRVFLAMQMMAVDAAGIVAGALMTLVASIAIVAVFQIPRFIISSQSWQWGFVGLVLALSWYALLAAATASLSGAMARYSDSRGR